MEALQMAQIIADLSSLQNAEPSAAQNLLGANKNLNLQTLGRKSKASLLPEPPKFDRLGRRIIRTSSYQGSPIMNPLSRSGSGLSTLSSGAATPTANSSEYQDIDLARAKRLLELYEMRGKFKEMGDTGLARAQERVDKVVAPYPRK